MVRKFDASKYPIRIGGEVMVDDAELGLSRRRLEEMPLHAKWGILAARRAILDANLSLSDDERFATDIFIGVASPGLEVFQQQAIDVLQNGPTASQPKSPALANPANASVQISIDLGIQGEVVNFSTGCSSSAYAIGYAMRQIQQGGAACILAGGVDEGVSPFMLGSFGNGDVLSKRNDDPVHASRPFDRSRDGYVLSDAAGILILEEYERAKKRGARIYCEVSGFGATSDATSMLRVSKSEEAGSRAIEKALLQARTQPDEINYYCAHGSSSRWTDIRETRMVKRVFQEHARKICLSSIKSMMGHPLGASGVVQTAASALAIQNKAIPPTINYEDSDPECDLDYVPNVARSANVRKAVIYSLGQGGSNTALVLNAC
jgi:3-oxoacyl-[acyl-carrier-protein] synthase II